MKTEKDIDDLDVMDDDDLTVTQLRKRIKQLRKRLSDKTEEEKEEETSESESERESLSDLHEEKKSTSSPFEDSENAIAIDNETGGESDDNKGRKEKSDSKKEE